MTCARTSDGTPPIGTGHGRQVRVFSDRWFEFGQKSARSHARAPSHPLTERTMSERISTLTNGRSRQRPPKGALFYLKTKFWPSALANT